MFFLLILEVKIFSFSPFFFPTLSAINDLKLRFQGLSKYLRVSCIQLCMYLCSSVILTAELHKRVFCQQNSDTEGFEVPNRVSSRPVLFIAEEDLYFVREGGALGHAKLLKLPCGDHVGDFLGFFFFFLFLDIAQPVP